MPWLKEKHEIYHATQRSWGSTLAKLALESPRKAKDMMEKLIPRPDNPSFNLGTAWHSRLTGVGDQGIVRPADLDGRTKEGKAWLADHADRVILTAEQGRILDLMASRMPPHLRELCDLRRAADACELAARVDHAGWSAQARPDMVDDAAGVIYDLKTTGKSIEDFQRSAFQFGYPLQAGWYRSVVAEAMNEGARRRFILIVSETVSPWRTVLMTPDPDWIAYGDTKATEAAAVIQRCYDSGDWSDKSPQEMGLSLPAWATKADVTENADGGIDLEIV